MRSHWARSAASITGTDNRVRRPGGTTSDGSGAPFHGSSPVRRLGVALAVAAGLGLVFAASALALKTHPFISAFTGSDTPAGSFATADKVGVDSASGDVYVIDKGHGVVDKFNSSGNFLSQLPTSVGGGDPDIAVDNSSTGSAGNVYVLPEFGPLSAFDSSGNPLYQLDGSTTPDGSFGDACGAATDTSGDVYVSSFSNQAIYEFDSAGTFIRKISTGISECDIAVDGSGDPSTILWVIQWNQALHKVSFDGTDQGVVDSNHPTAVSVDPSDHHVYVDDQASNGTSSIAEYDSNGILQGSFGGDRLVGSRGVDVNGSTGNVYVSNNGTPNEVDIFGPAVEVPDVTTGTATDITATSATLRGTVNPDGITVTDCHFNYGPTPAYGQTAPCVPSPGSGTDNVAVSAAVTGLSPDTTYHFQLVASNANGSNEGLDATFDTPGVVDNRAYEQVSPVDKNGSDILPGGLAAPSGDTFTEPSFGAFGDAKANELINQFVSSRSASGWSTHGITLPASPPAVILLLNGLYSGFSTDLGHGVSVNGDPAVDGATPHTYNLYDRTADDSVHLVTHDQPAPPAPPATPPTPTFDSASADFSHIVFDEQAAINPGDPTGVTNLYESTGGSVRLVNVLPGGTPDPNGGAAGSGGFSGSTNAVSADGSRIFWTDHTNLYVRENGASTTQIDAPQGGSGPGGGGQFWTATPDGSQVFFTDDASAGLTANTHSGSGTNLYRYNVDTGTLTNLTAAPDARVQGVVGASDNGSRIYFVAQGALAPGASSDAENLYVLTGGVRKFITTLSDSDSADWQNAGFGLKTSSVQVSSDGRFLLFTTRAPQPNGFNNDGHSEIYLYDNSGSGSPTCVSCREGGGPATGDAVLNDPSDAYIPLQFNNFSPFRNMSSDGGRVFFTAHDPLVGADTNDQYDVYEYENGKAHLVSTGKSGSPSVFGDTTPSGDDAFFLTRQSLVTQDTDNNVDVYDARVNGGIPSQNPAPAPPPCTGDACKPAPTPPPSEPTLETVFFHGNGKFKAAPITPAAQRRFARTGKLSERVAVRRPGMLRAAGEGIRRAHRRATRHHLRLRLHLHLTTAAGKALRRDGAAKVTIKLHFRGGAKTAKLTLRRAR